MELGKINPIDTRRIKKRHDSYIIPEELARKTIDVKLGQMKRKLLVGVSDN